MRFTCEKAVLLSAVGSAMRTVSTHTSIPALEGILIEASNTTVTFTGYNLSTGIKACIEAECEKPGAIVLKARLFGEIIRKSPDDMITIESDENLTVTIKCGMSEFTLVGLPASDYPDLPEPQQDKRLTVSQKKLKSMIGMTLFAVSDNESKPIHTGSLFDIKEGLLTVVSLDGFRMAMRREEVDTTGEKFSFVVPGPALREVERLCADSDDSVSVSLGNRHITFEIEGVMLISRLLEGEFINYENVIPRNIKNTVVAQRNDLLEAVERVSLIINEKIKNPVRCVFGKNRLELSCATALGKANDVIDINNDGEELEIGFNNRYLLEALREVPDESVVFHLVDALSPCVIRPEEGDAYLYMILPVRMRN